jgi:outer membrane lipoprotein carrier protein
VSLSRRIVIAALFAVLLASAPAAAPQASTDPEARRLAAAIDRRYNALQTLSAEFTTSYSGVGMARTESGSLQLKRPGRMRWDYRDPREKLFVTDGKVAWFYVPGDRQARRMQLRDLDDLRTPLAYLLGRARLEREFMDLTVARDVQPRDEGNYVLRGVPRHMEDRIEQVLLEVSPDHHIVGIQVEEVDGSITDFRFTQMTENAHVADSRFRFQPPRGVDVLDTRDLAP